MCEKLRKLILASENLTRILMPSPTGAALKDLVCWYFDSRYPTSEVRPSLGPSVDWTLTACHWLSSHNFPLFQKVGRKRHCFRWILCLQNLLPPSFKDLLEMFSCWINDFAVSKLCSLFYTYAIKKRRFWVKIGLYNNSVIIISILYFLEIFEFTNLKWGGNFPTIPNGWKSTMQKWWIYKVFRKFICITSVFLIVKLTSQWFVDRISKKVDESLMNLVV